jgi:hypothetical protein
MDKEIKILTLLSYLLLSLTSFFCGMTFQKVLEVNEGMKHARECVKVIEVHHAR